MQVHFPGAGVGIHSAFARPAPPSAHSHDRGSPATSAAKPYGCALPQTVLADPLIRVSDVSAATPVDARPLTDAVSLQPALFQVVDANRIETFERTGDGLATQRRVVLSDGTVQTSTVSARSRASELGPASSEFDLDWLMSQQRPSPSPLQHGVIRVVDLFSGCGAMSLGVEEACRALGLRCDHVFAVDGNAQAVEAYARNFPSARCEQRDVLTLLDRRPGESMSSSERRFQAAMTGIDLVIGGPPCQGNSDLNNHTRRADPKNSLYLTMARCAEVLAPEHLMIENVPGVVHDKNGVVAETWSHLRRLGYEVDGALLDASTLGVAQRRRRFFLVASRSQSPRLSAHLARFETGVRDLRWAIGDLVEAPARGLRL